MVNCSCYQCYCVSIKYVRCRGSNRATRPKAPTQLRNTMEYMHVTSQAQWNTPGYEVKSQNGATAQMDIKTNMMVSKDLRFSSVPQWEVFHRTISDYYSLLQRTRISSSYKIKYVWLAFVVRCNSDNVWTFTKSSNVSLKNKRHSDFPFSLRFAKIDFLPPTLFFYVDKIIFSLRRSSDASPIARLKLKYRISRADGRKRKVHSPTQPQDAERGNGAVAR